MLHILIVISQKICCRKEACGYAKVNHKKEKEKRDEKNGHKSVQDIENNGYLDARLKKRKRDE